MTDAEPDWLAEWRRRRVGPDEAHARFDGLPVVALPDAVGRWRGRGLATGHPYDGLLEALGWHGKRVAGPDEVWPLIFRSGGGVLALRPALMPAGLALSLPGLARSAPVRVAFAALRPLLATRRPGARLRTVEHRGKASAAIVYDRLPMIDHLRRAGERRLLGVMDMRGAPPFFFLLEREG